MSRQSFLNLVRIKSETQPASNDEGAVVDALVQNPRIVFLGQTAVEVDRPKADGVTERGRRYVAVQRDDDTTTGAIRWTVYEGDDTTYGTHINFAVECTDDHLPGMRAEFADNHLRFPHPNPADELEIYNTTADHRSSIGGVALIPLGASLAA